MQERLERRLAELMGEREAGHKVQAELQAQLAELEHTLLRISGAIQVLEEILDEDDTAEPGDPAEPAGDDHDPADDEPAPVAAPGGPSSPVTARPVTARPVTPTPPPPPVPWADGARPAATSLGDT